MQKLTTHYHSLLRLPLTWSVDAVDFFADSKRIEIHARFIGGAVVCPGCGLAGKVYDRVPEQRWRHLDTMQYETIIIARIPRCQCIKCGVKTLAVPWAERHSRFTLMFEGFAVDLLQHCSNTNAAADMLELGWHATDEIMNRAVKRGLSRRAPEEICNIGIDEKSFRKGHKYITTLNDINGSRVLDVVESRTLEATETLLQTLTESQRESVKSVSLDMWQAFATAVKKCLPKADIVHDRFHISKYLNDAVDKVRRHESAQLYKIGDKTLVGSRFCWLRNPENMKDTQRAKFELLMEGELKTGVAWSIKNGFRLFWNLTTEVHGGLFLSYWSDTVDQSGLTPMIEVKDMLNRHRDNLLNYFKHRVSNAVSEGLNSKIQTIKASARGFHKFESYRTRILFYCGKLDMGIA